MPGENLRVIAGPAAGKQIQLGDEFQIGRAAAGEGTLGDDPELSRVHAKVTRNPNGQIVIQDLGSTNGTVVNGQRITGPVALNPGDTVQLGRTTLQFQGGAAQQATALGAAPPAGAAAAAAGPPPPAPPPSAPAPGQPAAAPFGGAQGGRPGAPPPPPSNGGGSRRPLVLGLGALALVAAIVVAVVLLAGGGDGGGGGSEDEVRDTIAAAFDNDCDAFSDEYLADIFGTAGEGTPRARCEQASEELTGTDEFEVTSVEVDGDTANAEVEAGGDEGRFELEQDGDDWVITDVGGELGDTVAANAAEAGGGTETSTAPATTPTTPTTPEQTTTEEPDDPREIEAIATLQALIDAIQEDDEQVFCGLLSPRQAQKLVGGAGGDAAIARCVQVAGRVDLSRGVPRRIRVTGVRVTGNQASVRLTTGERFTLVRRRGRFVVDCCLG